jgi:hypothetical protein
LILKMEASYSSETSVVFQRTTRRCIKKDRILHNHRCENLKTYTVRRMISKIYVNKYVKVWRLLWCCRI